MQELQAVARINLKGFDALMTESFGEVKAAVNMAAQDLARIARTKTAPVDKGDLRRATNAEAEFIYAQGSGQGLTISKRVVAAEDYAYIQHEEDYEHPKGGQQYYLSGPLEEKEAQYTAFIGAAVKRALDKAAMD